MASMPAALATSHRIGPKSSPRAADKTVMGRFQRWCIGVAAVATWSATWTALAAQETPPAATDAAPATRSAEVRRITLPNGDQITGTFVSETDLDVTIEHPALGLLTVPKAKAASIETPASREEPAMEANPVAPTAALPGPVAPTPPTKTAPAEKPGLFGGPILRGYRKVVNLGVTGTDGNTETLTFLARLQATSKTPEKDTELRAHYDFARNGKGRTRNEVELLANRDWKQPDSKWFFFGRAQYEWDEFEAWQHRVGVFGGPGFEFYDSTKFRFVGRLGVGGTYEFGEVDNFRPEGLVGFEGHWQVKENQKFLFRNTTFPLLDDFGEYRNVTELSYVIDLDAADKLQVKFGIENEYESTTENDSKHNDIKYFAALVMEF